MTAAPGSPTVLDRKAIRAAAIDLHRLASDMRERRGMVPVDDPPGYVEAFASHLRAMARLCEEAARTTTCAGVKRLAIDGREIDATTVDGLARQRAVNALLVTVNLHAVRSGLDPYQGMRP